MKKRSAEICIGLGIVVWLVLAAGSAAGQPLPAQTGTSIPWKTPVAGTSASGRAAARVVLGAGGPRHVVVQFAEPVTDAARAKLEAGGVALLNYLGANAYFATVAAGPKAAGAAADVGVAAAYDIELPWKLHPKVARHEYPDYAVFKAHASQDDDAKAAAGALVETAALYVIFHPDVDLITEGEPALVAHGGHVRDYMMSINAVVAWLPVAAVEAFAADDAVQWVEPPLPPLDAVNNSNREITQTNTVNDPPYSLDGSGVSVMVYDAGTARATHLDFSGRLTVRDSSGMYDHSTHVAGTVGGDGTASAGMYRGMAPAVTIESYGFEYDGSGTFLYTNPGDLEDDYTEAISYGAEIANNSIGTNVAWNGFPCDWEGDYGATSILIDAIVGGSLGDPMRIVWANGNERGGACGSGYHLTAPPACAKNHITVGALNSNDDSMTSFSSWGPTDDGRMKPDVAGPGCQSNDDGGVTSCYDASDTAYTTMCGTSMAAPTVTGICALILQDWKALFPTEPLPRNSTLKVFLAHNAVDLGNPGPDYQFGFGSVRAQNSIDFLRTGTFVEEAITQGEDKLYFVYVPAGADSLKATIAWDDPPGAVNTTPELVNDLDIVAIAPGGGATHYPWSLNPANPGDPAVQTQADHRNNIEQVLVDSPAEGTWTIVLSGYSVAVGPQVFSLATTPGFSTATSEGVILLDGTAYACTDTASITVSDTDLNTNALAAETVNVSIDSDTEPAGETVTLTETGPDTATFVGAIDLVSVDVPGSLHVSDGDTVTATYIDADDGQGGLNVTVTDTAAVDCQGPVISNVTVDDIRASRATVSFETDERATGAVRYGEDCGDLTDSASGIGLRTGHTVVLNGLDSATTYYFVVDATDTAGNVATDDNGGLCHTFTTPEQTDYFTEIFTSDDNDLDNQTLHFTPGDPLSYYQACAEAATAFPTDPAGATVLSLGDDDAAQVTLSEGHEVALYGQAYSTFFVGSNGYITFTAGDGTYSESLAGHFSFPRISALFDDLYPPGGGTISWQEFSDRAVVTYQSVPEYGNPVNVNTFQVEMFYDGVITITHLGLASSDGLVGLSDGMGTPEDFAESDLSAYGECDFLVVDPRDGLSASGYEGGPFTPDSKVYTLTNEDPAAALDWSAAATESWLDVTPNSGTLAALDAVPVTVALNAAAQALAPATYTDAVTFTNVGTAFDTARGVELEVIPIPGEIVVTDTILPSDDLAMPFGDVIETLSRTEQATVTNSDPTYDLVLPRIYLSGQDFIEDFDDGLAQGWEEITDEFWEVVDQEYRAQTLFLSASMQAMYTGQTWQDLAARVVMRRTGVDTSMAGLVVRATEDFSYPDLQGSAYAVGISGNGSYWVGRWVSGAFDFLQSWTFSSYLNLDTVPNEVQINIQGDAIDVYFNGNLAWSGTDSSITEEGQVAVMGYTGDGTTHYFDDVLVSDSLSGGKAVSVEQQWYNDHPAAGHSCLVAPQDAVAPGFPGAKGGPGQDLDGIATAAPAFRLENLPTLPATVPPGGFITFDVVFQPLEASAEPYTATLNILSNDDDEPHVEVALSGSCILDDLTVAPQTDFIASGELYGPFTPDSAIYTLTNNGAGDLDWSAAPTEPWLTITPNSGTLTTLDSTPVTVALNANADSLSEGVHTDTVTFTNEGTTREFTRGVELTIVLPPPVLRVETTTLPFETTLYPNEQASIPDALTLCNDAVAWAINLDYRLSVEYTGGPGSGGKDRGIDAVRQAVASTLNRSGIGDGPINVPGEINAVTGQVMAPRSIDDPRQIAHVLTAAEAGIDTASSLDVAVYGAEDVSWTADIQAKLVATGFFNSVTAVDARAVTPTLAELEVFDAVLVYSDYPYADPVGLGNVMADYVDAGGGVVCALFEIGGQWFDPDLAMQGRWATGGYVLMDRSDYVTSPESLGTIHDPSHPIMAGVTTFSGGDAGFRPATTGVYAGVDLIAEWGDGRPLVAASPPTGTPRADLGFFPVSGDIRPELWDPATDGDLLMANALTWVTGMHGWLSAEEPTVGAVPGETCAQKDVSFDSTDLLPGTYTANLIVDHNDPFHAAVSLPAVLYVEGWGGFLDNPDDASVYIGEAHTFSVEASHGTSTPVYQWWYDDDAKAPTLIPGANTTTLALDPVAGGDAADYWCEATYEGVTYASTTATLGVADHLSITDHPESADVQYGAAHTLTVETHGGFSPLQYVWRKDGVEIGYDAEYAIDPMRAVHQGVYAVEVRDAITDVVTSNTALISLIPGMPVGGSAAVLGLLLSAFLVGGAVALRRTE